MACRYTYKGKTYEAHEFDDVLREMSPAEASAFMPSVESVPGAPFVQKTDAWVALALKRVIHMAATEGYDRVAFVTGKQSAERFSLDKHLSLIEFGKTGSDAYRVKAYDKNDGVVRNMPSEMSAAELERHLGKEIAEKIVAAGNGRLEGDGLKVEASGMRAFYDQIVPKVAKDVLRKVGGDSLRDVKIERGNPAQTYDKIKPFLEWMGRNHSAYSAHEVARMWASGPDNNQFVREYLDATRTLTQPGFDITPAMREAAGGGMPLFSGRTGRGSRYDLGKFGVGSQFIEAIQDRYNRWKQAIESVRGDGGTITEANNFYLTEERYWGKVGSRIGDFHDELLQFVKAVAKDRLTLDDVAKYSYALHAKERNEALEAKRGPAPAGTGWSGMSTQDAADILYEAHISGLEPVLQKHAATLRSWIEGTRKIMLDEGLIDQDTHDSLERSYQHYVPLRGLPEKYQTEAKRGTGQGFSIRGQETKRAMGRKSEARQIIENIVQDRTRALIRAGKNEVGRSFLQFVLDNPDPDLWQVNEVRIKPVETVDALGDRIIEERPVIVSDDTTISVKDGGKEIRISVKDERLRTQLQNLHAESLARPVAAMLWVNRKLGQLYTSLSPVFVVLNGARDLASATIGVIDELGFMAAPRLWAEMPRAIVESYMAEFGKLTPDYQLYKATGGKTGFFDFKTIDSQTAELRKLMADADRLPINPRVFLPKAMGLIEKLNGGIENATRLAAFKLARKSGRSVAEAASLAKNITVNFNRKGTMTPALSAWFLFFNPAVQGTARVLKAASHPKVAATLGMGMLGIAALALRNAAMGDDDDGVAWWDKIPDEIKERNLIIVLPPNITSGEEIPGTKNGRYVKVPMPYGYNFFASMANQAVDVWRNSQDEKRGRAPTKAAVKLFGAFMGAWIPVPELGKSFDDLRTGTLAFVPDAAGPVVQTWLNRNAFGREIFPSDRQSEHLPDAGKTFPNQVGTLYDKAAKGLNRLAGGSDYESSSWLTDIAPGSLETVIRGYGGGPVQFGLDIVNAIYVRQSISRDAVRTESLPFVKQLWGVIDAETDRLTGYERLTEAESRIAPYKRAVKDAQTSESAGEDAARLGEEWSEILALGDMVKHTRMRLADIRDRELQAVKSDEPDPVKYARLMQMAEYRRKELQNFNRAFDEATQERAKRLKRGGR